MLLTVFNRTNRHQQATQILFYRIMTNSRWPYTSFYASNRESTHDVDQPDSPQLATSVWKEHKAGLDMGAEKQEIWRCDLQNGVRKTFGITALPKE